jgi:hypothetical protein
MMDLGAVLQCLSLHALFLFGNGGSGVHHFRWGVTRIYLGVQSTYLPRCVAGEVPGGGLLRRLSSLVLIFRPTNGRAEHAEKGHIQFDPGSHKQSALMRTTSGGHYRTQGCKPLRERASANRSRTPQSKPCAGRCLMIPSLDRSAALGRGVPSKDSMQLHDTTSGTQRAAVASEDAYSCLSQSPASHPSVASHKQPITPPPSLQSLPEACRPA